jgi:hypothetical protein
MSLTDAEVIALAERIRERAKAFMQEAADPADDCRNIAKLTAMASSLNWAARELCLCARVDLTRRPDPPADERGPELSGSPAGASSRRRRLYRLAHPAGDRRCIPIGRARESFDAVVNAAQEYNDIRQQVRMPVLTHVVVYEQVEIVELTALDLEDPAPGASG